MISSSVPLLPFNFHTDLSNITQLLESLRSKDSPTKMSHGYYGTSYDRQVERTETSTFHKMKETFWTTKQAVIQKLGKKEDEHVVASDAELDSKLEVFRAIQKSSMELLRVIEKYQDRLCMLSQEENATGRYLKSKSGLDKTRAGKIMAAVGKSQSFAAQQRLSLRVPLVRLYQEVETFRYRAISDTLMTINRMEAARTEYRGALLWMKAVSEELDPDTYKQLEKFRKVQGQVRKTKARFDKLKLDVMQKIDLLAASRCNMFSHVLANYQSTLLHFWEKTSRTMSAVAESFKGYQHFEFSIVKELAEPSKQLAEQSKHNEPAERDTDSEEFDPSNDQEEYSKKDEKPSKKSVSPVNDINLSHNQKHIPKKTSDEDPLLEEDNSHIKDNNHISCKQSHLHSNNSEEVPLLQEERLINFDEEDKEDQNEGDISTTSKKDGSLQNLYESENEVNEENQKTDKKTRKKDDSISFMEFEEDTQQKEDFDFSGKIIPMENKPKISKKDVGSTDLLSDELTLEQDDTEKDDISILNEILNTPSTGENDFSMEWQAVFGNTPLSAGTTYTPVESDKPTESAEFMPSNLLDMTSKMSGMSIGQGPPGQIPSGTPKQQSQQQQQGSAPVPPQVGSGDAQQAKANLHQKKGQKTDMSAWFNLFADLDPLSNPDAIGKTSEDMTDA